jgi:enamine deaminase RidA (YjgF/YER057c/UK114 family)
VKLLLDHAGYNLSNVVDMTIFYAKGNDAGLGFRAFQEVFGTPAISPTITVIQIAQMANPERLVEVKAIAVK